MRRQERIEAFVGALLLVLVLAVVSSVVGGGMALYGHLIYEDWTCGFAKCIKLRP